jgi:hypothetical protein
MVLKSHAFLKLISLFIFRMVSHNIFTIWIFLFLILLIYEANIFMGSSLQVRLSWSLIDYIGKTWDRSEWCFFSIHTWKILWFLSGSGCNANLYTSGPTLSKISYKPIYLELNFNFFPYLIICFHKTLSRTPHRLLYT